jgi:hypothetical protein
VFVASPCHACCCSSLHDFFSSCLLLLLVSLVISFLRVCCFSLSHLLLFFSWCWLLFAFSCLHACCCFSSWFCYPEC